MRPEPERPEPDAHREGTEPVAHRTVVVEREYGAPARLLFLAYREPEHLMRWFGPKGYPLTVCEVDFRVGGTFHFAMTGPDGEQGPPFGGEYLEIVPDQKIVYTNRFLAEGSGRMVVTVTFSERDARTTLSVSTVFESVSMKDEYLGLGFAEGTRSGLDQLADLVRELA